jgi:hypothetical protein
VAFTEVSEELLIVNIPLNLGQQLNKVRGDPGSQARDHIEAKTGQPVWQDPIVLHL